MPRHFLHQNAILRINVPFPSIILFLSCLCFFLYGLSHLFLGLTAYYLKLDWFKFGFSSMLAPIVGALISYRKLSLILRAGAVDNESEYSVFFDMF